MLERHRRRWCNQRLRVVNMGQVGVSALSAQLKSWRSSPLTWGEQGRNTLVLQCLKPSHLLTGPCLADLVTGKHGPQGQPHDAQGLMKADRSGTLQPWSQISITWLLGPNSCDNTKQAVITSTESYKEAYLLHHWPLHNNWGFQVTVPKKVEFGRSFKKKT